MTNSTEHVLESVTLQTVGLSCGSCVKHTEEALQGTTGVSKAIVDLASQNAYIEYDPDQVDLPAIKKAVQDAGYDLILPESN